MPVLATQLAVVEERLGLALSQAQHTRAQAAVQLLHAFSLLLEATDDDEEEGEGYYDDDDIGDYDGDGMDAEWRP